MATMFGSTILDVVIGVVFLFLALSLVTSMLNEAVAGFLSLRGRTLEQGVRSMLNDPAGERLARQVYAHPLVTALAKQTTLDRILRRTPRPPYLPAAVFSAALMDSIVDTVVPDAPDRQKLMAELGNVVVSLPPEYDNIKRGLISLIDDAAGDARKIKDNLEKWFNDSMERVAGWYKRLAQKITVGVAIVLALITNADMLMVANALHRDSAVRGAVSAAAAEAVRSAIPGNSFDSLIAVNNALTRIDLTDLPVGWQPKPGAVADPRQAPTTLQGWLAKLAGIAFTTIAVSMGAPFWFNVLGNIVRLRIDGEPPSTAKGSNP